MNVNVSNTVAAKCRRLCLQEGDSIDGTESPGHADKHRVFSMQNITTLTLTGADEYTDLDQLRSLVTAYP